MSPKDFLEFEKTFSYLEPPYENEYVKVKTTDTYTVGIFGPEYLAKKRGKKTIGTFIMNGSFQTSWLLESNRFINNNKHN